MNKTERMNTENIAYMQYEHLDTKNNKYRFILTDFTGRPAGKGTCDVCKVVCYTRFYLKLECWGDMIPGWFERSLDCWAHLECLQPILQMGIPVLTYEEWQAIKKAEREQLRQKRLLVSADAERSWAVEPFNVDRAFATYKAQLEADFQVLGFGEEVRLRRILEWTLKNIQEYVRANNEELNKA